MNMGASDRCRWELIFNEAGLTVDFDDAAFFGGLEDQGIEDLFILSHGWNTDFGSARDLYNDMFPRIASACAAIKGLGKVGFTGVLWPSLWFPETPARVGQLGGSGQVDGMGDEEPSSGSNELSGCEIAESLLRSFSDAKDRKAICDIGRLIDEGTAAAAERGLSGKDAERLVQDIHALVRSLVPDGDMAVEDQGESLLFLDQDPTRTYQGVAQTFGTTPAGDDTAGMGDWFGRAIAGSKDTLRILSYTIMKHRAGTVGSVGLGGLLAQFPARAKHVRVHLIGHSFGARLVSFALATVGDPATSPIRSLLLLQGAFSHFAFSDAADNPFGKPGALHQFADRVRGPIVATYSVHDYALCRWYPKASFLSRDDFQATTVGRWDAMGSDGFQAVKPLEDRFLTLSDSPDLVLAPNRFYRVDAAAVIADVSQSAFSGAHSDIRKEPVAQLAATAAAAGLASS